MLADHGDDLACGASPFDLGKIPLRQSFGWGQVVEGVVGPDTEIMEGSGDTDPAHRIVVGARAVRKVSAAQKLATR